MPASGAVVVFGQLAQCGLEGDRVQRGQIALAEERLGRCDRGGRCRPRHARGSSPRTQGALRLAAERLGGDGRLEALDLGTRRGT